MAVGSQFQTDIPTMDVAAGHVAEVNGGIQSELSSLLSRLEPLMAAWQSGAATSFHTLKDRWHEGASRLNTTLGEIGTNLATASTNYATNDDDNRAGFDRISGSV